MEQNLKIMFVESEPMKWRCGLVGRVVLGSIPALHEQGMMHICNPSTQEVETRRSQVQL